MVKKKLGIIGGMGPLATAVFYEMLISHTAADCDQDHIETYIISNPEIPKRVEYIMGESDDSPAPYLSDIALKLQDLGAEIIVMPCVTAHFFYEETASKLTVPFLNILTETRNRLSENGIKKAGILATRATIKSGILQNVLREAGIDSIIPEDDEAGSIARIIYTEIKTGREPDRDSLYAIMDSMQSRGAETCLIACTDLSACLWNYRSNADHHKYTDLMEVLAETAVRECIG